MKLYMVPNNSLVKLSEGDGRVFKFLYTDPSFAHLRTENNTLIKLPATRDVIVVGKFSESVDGQL